MAENNENESKASIEDGKVLVSTTIVTRLFEKEEFFLKYETDVGPEEELVQRHCPFCTNVYIPESTYSKLLFFTVFVRDEESFIDLLENNNYNLNLVNEYEMSLFHIVASIGTLEMLKILVDRGALLDVGDTLEGTALHIAIRKRRRKIVRHLLDSGASVHSKNCESHTPLHYAVATKDMEIIDMLVKHGADVNADSEDNSPLFIACGQFSIWSNLTFVQRDEGSYVCDKGIIDYLLDHGAEINFKNVEGQTPLHLVCEAGNFEIMKHLVERGANINAKDFVEFSTLHYAVIGGNPDIIKLLLDKGVDLNNQDVYGQTPIRFAVAHGTNEPLEIITAYIAIMIIKKQYVCKQNQELLKSKLAEKIYKEYELQIGFMKTSICSLYNISFYDILKEDAHRVAAFARNTEFMEVLEASEYEKQFPKFSIFFKNSIHEAKRRLTLLNTGEGLLKRQLKLNLPWIIVDEIFRNLDEKDLKNFIMAFEKKS